MSSHGALRCEEADNVNCLCFPLERDRLIRSMIASFPVLERQHFDDKPNLLASTGVFVSDDEFAHMLAQINAIEAAIMTAGYRAQIAKRDQGISDFPQQETRGAFMGYDFHLSEDGPRLIEINTNAGGAFIVHALYEATQETNFDLCSPYAETAFETLITTMIIDEWRLAGRTRQPARIAIVEDDPKVQFLYPDMCLARDMLASQFAEVHLLSVDELAFSGGKLLAGGRPIDLVYNRLTDFSLTDARSKALRSAYLDDAVVVSPSPLHHALYADKRNLVLLSDSEQVSAFGISEAHSKALHALPETRGVTSENADALWATRKQWFFKPRDGFGSRAAYRGDKLTRKTWEHITQSDYVAQAIIPPSLRKLETSAGEAQLKFDVRVYTYASEPLILAARIYQGQTTNFRTDGGGFAPVIITKGANC